MCRNMRGRGTRAWALLLAVLIALGMPLGAFAQLPGDEENELLTSQMTQNSEVSYDGDDTRALGRLNNDNEIGNDPELVGLDSESTLGPEYPSRGADGFITVESGGYITFRLDADNFRWSNDQTPHWNDNHIQVAELRVTAPDDENINEYVTEIALNRNVITVHLVQNNTDEAIETEIQFTVHSINDTKLEIMESVRLSPKPKPEFEITGFNLEKPLEYEDSFHFAVSGGSLRFPLTTETFVWEGDKVPDSLQTYHYSDLIYTLYDEDYIEKIFIDYNHRLVVWFAEGFYYDPVEDADLTFTMFIGDDEENGLEVIIEGPLYPENSLFFDEDEEDQATIDSYIIDDGDVIFPLNNYKNARLSLDNLDIIASLEKGKHYCVETTRSTPQTAYPQITDLIGVELHGFDPEAVKVEMTLHSNNFLVYEQTQGDNFVLLGRCEEPLPLRDKYYLAAHDLSQKVEPTVRVIYDLNGAKGTAPTDDGLYYVGQTVDLVNLDYLGIENGKFEFDGWNTAPDGSGIRYRFSSWLWEPAPRTSPATIQRYYLDEAGNFKVYAMWSCLNGTRSDPLYYNGDGDPANLSLNAGDKIYISIDPDKLLWKDQWYDEEKPVLTAAILGHSRFTVRRTITTGGILIKDVYMEDTDDGAVIVCEFIPNAPVLDTRFQYRINLYYNGSRIAPGVTISGTMKGTGITDSGNNNKNNNGGSSRRSGGGGGGGGGSGLPLSNTTPAITRQPVSATEIVPQVRAAVAQAVAGNTTATVKVQNASEISLQTMRQMAEAATAAGGPVLLYADNVTNGAVDVRLRLNPALATADLKLAASTSSATARSTLATFQRYYANQVAVISFEQAGGFGQAVRVAAKLDLTGFDTANLAFYAYDRAGNTFQRLPETDYRIDSAGYLHFNTALAGDIVVSNGVLQKR